MSTGADVLPDLAGALVDRRDMARTQASVLEGLFGIPREPTRIGRFELLGTVGSGAMGRVYAARDPRLDRRVAIKLLRPDIAAGPLAAARRRRLVAEAQALARLSHPNVVEVFEVGTEGAEVYVVMELVDGASLRQWLARQQPEPSAIVDAFVAAGRGLAAAHAAGIVHRDFKPDNVLVGQDGRVRVADFGVAIASDDSSVGSPASPTAGTVTVRGAAGTPGYVAPEVVADGQADAWSDQFSFCVSLVEALSGKRPEGPDDVPPLPLPATMAAAVRRGLCREPRARHDSMTTLVAQLAGRRHNPAWLVSMAVGASIVGGALWSTGADPTEAEPHCRAFETLADPTWSDARRQRLRAAIGADDGALGEQAWARAEPMIDTFVSAVAQRRASTCERSTSAQVVADADACATARLTDLDLVLGTFERGEAGAQHIVPALDRVTRETGCEGADDPEHRALHAELLRAQALVSAGSERGVALAEEVRQQATQRADTRTVIEADLVLARAEIGDDQPSAGIERLRGAYFAAVELADEPLAARAALMLGYHAVEHESDEDEARAWAQHAEAHTTRIDEPVERQELAINVDALWAKLALEARDAASASTLVQDALTSLRRHPRPDPALEARLLRMRGQALLQHGRLDEALFTLESARKSTEAHFGAAHPNTLNGLSDVGTMLFQLGRYDEARERFRQVVAGKTAAFGPDDPSLGTVLTALGAAEGSLGNYDAAREVLLRGHEVLLANFGEDHDRVALNLLNLSEVEKHLGDLEAALRHREQATAIQRRLFGEDSPHMVNLYNALGSLYTTMGRNDEAVTAHRRALAIAEGPADVTPSVTVAAYLGLARAVGDDEPEVAIGYLETVLPIIAESVGPRHEDYAIALTNLAALQVTAGRPGDALAPALQSLAIYEGILDADDPDLAYGLLAAASAEVARGLGEDALSHAERAVQIRKSHDEVPDYLTARAQLVLARALWLERSRRDEALAVADQARSTLQAAGEDGVPGLDELAAWEASR